ncbi:MAG: carboxypeptidase-like regulatory domain-containing protein [Planctomycetota bacterium]
MSPKTLLLIVALVAGIGLTWFLTLSPDGEPEGGGLQVASSGPGETLPGPETDESALQGSETLVQTGERELGAQAAPTSDMPVPTRTEAQGRNEDQIAVTGRLIDEAGKPVVGAELFFRRQESGDDDFGMFLLAKEETPEGQSNGQGRFTLMCEPGGRGNLRIEKAGLLSQTHKDTWPESGVWDLGEIVLHPAMVLEGRVVDVRGAGIPGVRILPLEQSQGGFFLAIDGNVQGQAETGPDGSFRLDTLKPGAWRVHLKAPVHRDRVLTGEMPTGLYQGGLLWTLEDGLTLRGAVEGMPEQAPSDLWVRANIEGGGQRGRGPW